MSDKGYVIVDTKYLIYVLSRSLMLSALEGGGVDNWIGFEGSLINYLDDVFEEKGIYYEDFEEYAAAVLSDLLEESEDFSRYEVPQSGSPHSKNVI